MKSILLKNANGFIIKKLWHTEDGSQKYPISACGLRDHLSGDMLA